MGARRFPNRDQHHRSSLSGKRGFSIPLPALFHSPYTESSHLYQPIYLNMALRWRGRESDFVGTDTVTSPNQHGDEGIASGKTEFDYDSNSADRPVQSRLSRRYQSQMNCRSSVPRQESNSLTKTGRGWWQGSSAVALVLTSAVLICIFSNCYLITREINALIYPSNWCLIQASASCSASRLEIFSSGHDNYKCHIGHSGGGGAASARCVHPATRWEGKEERVTARAFEAFGRRQTEGPRKGDDGCLKDTSSDDPSRGMHGVSSTRWRLRASSDPAVLIWPFSC